MNRGNYRILLIPGDSRYDHFVHQALKREGYEVVISHLSPIVAECSAGSVPDLVIAICEDGSDACHLSKAIRDLSSIPMIVVIDSPDSAERIDVLDAGADDCLSEPFGMGELLARVRAGLRRVELSGTTASTCRLEVGELVIDFRQRRVFCRGCEVHLSAIESSLLCLLARHPNEVLVQDYLLERVWGLGYAGEPQVLWTTVHRLRQKIEPDPNNPQIIQTRSGLGYVLTTPN